MTEERGGGGEEYDRETMIIRSTGRAESSTDNESSTFYPLPFRISNRAGRGEGWRDRRQVEKAFLSLEAEWSEQELDWREQPRRPILIRLINSPRRDYSVSWQVNHAERRSDPRRKNRGIARRRGRWIHRNCTYLCKWPTPLQPLFVLQIWHSTPQEPGGHLCFMTRQSNARLCALPTWPIIADRLIRILRVGFPSV